MADIELDRAEVLHAACAAAIFSKNPTLQAALDALLVAVRLAEPERFALQVELEAAIKRLQMRDHVLPDKEAIYDRVDEVLGHQDPACLVALENFIDIASEHSLRRRHRARG